MNRVTTGTIASRSGVPLYALRRIIDAHFPDHVERCGRYRTVPAALVPTIVEKAAALGYSRGRTPRPHKLTA